MLTDELNFTGFLGLLSGLYLYNCVNYVMMREMSVCMFAKCFTLSVRLEIFGRVHCAPLSVTILFLGYQIESCISLTLLQI